MGYSCQERLLHVGFNAHLLSRSRSYRAAGVSRHIENLLPQLAKRTQLTVFAGRDGVPAKPDGLTYRVTRLPTERPAARIAWEQALAPIRTRGLDVLACPAYVVPLAARCPTVVTVHDLSFLRMPGAFNRGNRLYLSVMTALSVRRARRVIAVSESTKRELIQLLRTPAAKVAVVPNGIEPVFRPLPAAAVAAFRAKNGLPDRFILSMCTLEPRKNLVALVRAYARAKLDIPLVLAGGKGWQYEQVLAEARQLGDRVLLPGYVPFADQPLWYNAAAVFAYPSLYEGFGFPPLEAMSCGTPVVSSNTTSLPEVIGDAGLLVDPTDEAALANALSIALTDEPLRERLRAAGPVQARRFDWATIATRTVDVYGSALR